MRKCIQLEMYPTQKQQTIMHRWFTAYLKMYNATIYYIKHNGINTLNYKKLRTDYLKNIRDTIKNESQIIHVKENTKIKCHILDCAIKLACANYKSAITNYKRGNIRQFRIRYWRCNKDTHILEIEKSFFKNSGLCTDIFGDINCTYNGTKFDLRHIEDTYKTGCTIQYKTKINKYYLLVPDKVEPKYNENIKREGIVLDPGIRKFLTGLSEDEIVKFGEGLSNKIKKYLELIDSINSNDKIPLKIKRININRYNRKISDIVNEMHWKIIKYLTDNYKTILIGDMSVKGITDNNKSVLNKMTKRIGYRLKFYQFRQRLEYKCLLNKINYQVIDEKFTSKMCSHCGNCKDNLGGSEIYNCDNCKNVMDRDVNGCRGIYIKSFSK